MGQYDNVTEGELFGGTGPQPEPQEKELAHGHDFQELFTRLGQSAFRSRFRLKTADYEYLKKKGMATVRRHAEDFVRRRLAPASIPNDGRQTPMRRHPVFIAQHATGCCCRGCLAKWHGIAPGHTLTSAEQHYVVDVIMEWIRRQTE